MTLIPGCVSEPLGCGLIDTPGDAKVHGAPSLPSIVSALYPPPAARKNPRSASRAIGEAVKPSAASSAATTPLSAARPAWKGLVIVPQFSRNPAACVAPRLNARRVASRSRPRTFAAPAAAPIAPHVAVL